MLARHKNHLAIIAVAIIFALAVFSAEIFAQGAAAKQISIQGRLTDANGKLLDGNYQLKFDFVDSATGAVLGTVGPQAASVKKGIFSALITPPASVDFSKPYQVAVYVNNEKLAPNFVLSYAPYSLRAVTADTAVSANSASAANSLSVSCVKCVSNSNLADNSVGVSKLGDDSITTSKIQGLQITNDKIALGTITGDRIADGTITASDVNFISAGSKSGASSYTINFNQVDPQYGRKSSFGAAPIIVCTAKMQGLICNIQARSKDNFIASVVDSSGNAQTSEIYWIAIGS